MSKLKVSLSIVVILSLSLMSSRFSTNTTQSSIYAIEPETGNSEIKNSESIDSDVESSTANQPALFDFSVEDRNESEAKVSQAAWAEFLQLKTRKENSIGIQLCLIPPGKFVMGSNETNEQLVSKGYRLNLINDKIDEQPQHQVQISKPFYVGIHEVTLRQFLEYYNASPEEHRIDAQKDGRGGSGFDGLKFGMHPTYMPWNTGWNTPTEDFLDHPVVNVSWNDANGFCKWLSEKEGEECRLLTEAEWEYACRAGSFGSMFSFGDNYNDIVKHCNISDLSAKTYFGAAWNRHHNLADGNAYTAKVGSYPPNKFGLFDMHGNGREWCADSYDANAYKYRVPSISDPTIQEDTFRVIRGGSWINLPVDCRAADRQTSSPNSRSSNTTFRIAITL